jgi:short-subunit dehydrogenase
MSAEGYDMSNAQQIIDVNLLGTLRAFDCVLPTMLSQRNGSLIFISSTASLRPSMISAAYAASKAGISMAVRSLRVRYRHSGVRFATVVLGPIATEMWEGKRSFLIPSKEKAAAAIAKFVFSNRNTLYYPALTTWLLRCTLWLPDSVFSILSTKLLKK